MIATTLIFVAGLALFTVAGVALFAVHDPRGRWLTPAAPAAGAALLIVLAHFIGFVLAGKLTTILVLLVVIALLAVGVWRRPAPRRLGTAFALTAGEALVMALGAAAGLLLLAPVFSIGFPTTIAGGIADGWSRSVLTEWLIDNPLSASVHNVGDSRPVGSYSAVPPDLGAGFEYLATMVSTLTGRRGFEVALPVATLAAPISVGGWAWLHGLVAQRPVRPWQAAVLVLAAACPLFAIALAENYLTQAMAIGLWPFAMAATYRFTQQPSVGSAALAAIGLGGAGAVYPQLAPWIGPPAVLFVLVMAWRDAGPRLDRVRPRLRRPAAALASLLVLGIAVMIVAPIEVFRGLESIGTFSGLLTSNSAFPLYQAEQDLELVLGGASQYTLPASPTPASQWQLVPAVGLMLGVVAAGVAALWTMRGRERRPLLALLAGVGGITLVLYVKYKHGDGYGYGTYKSLISGGALLGGLLAFTLASETARLQTWRVVAAGVCLAVWVPTTASILQQQRHGAQGFREADRALIRQLQGLPKTDMVLVDGAAENPWSFRLRMATGYTAGAFTSHKLEGLGSTFSYFSGGGSPNWRPTRPWRFVVASDAPSAFPVARRTIWHVPPFRIQEAPELDVTPYVAGGGRYWQTPPAGSPPLDYIAGPVELIVGNRGAQEAAAVVELRLKALRHARTVTLSAGDATKRRVELGKERPRDARYLVRVPAGGTARVTIDPGSPEPGAGSAPQPLLALTEIAVR